MKQFLITAAILGACVAMAESSSTIYSIPVKDIDGKATSLGSYKGKVLLVVNVASRCGLTPQYEQLEAVYQKYKDKGLVIVGFPCNDFAGQEPGTNPEIKAFCSTKYKVDFPLFDKLHVKGPEQHPLYTYLTGKGATYPGDVKWNFGKFLVGRDGQVLKRFEPPTKPDAPEVTQAIEAALAAK